MKTQQSMNDISPNMQATSLGYVSIRNIIYLIQTYFLFPCCREIKNKITVFVSLVTIVDKIYLQKMTVAWDEILSVYSNILLESLWGWTPT